ncbi:MAG: OFA family MFS transporter [Vulcanimicrobiaceae bacterium]
MLAGHNAETIRDASTGGEKVLKKVNNESLGGVMVASAPSQNRWLIAIAGTLVMICLGTVYSWSLFTRPLIAAFHWSNQDVSWTFAIAIFFLGIGAVIGGRWQDRVSPRTVTIVGVALWGIGVLLAGVGTPALGKWWLYLTYGVVGGLGLGMAYITPVAMVTKWFPDKRGLASGMVVMGFGLGAFIYNQIVPKIASFAVAAKKATAYVAAAADAKKAGTVFDPSQYGLSSADISAIMMVFIISGIVFLLVGCAAAFLLANPPAGYSVAGAVATAAESGRSYTPTEVLATPQFYMLWLILFLNVTAGILIISNAVPIYSDLTGATAAAAAGIYGTVAIFNGLGRFFWGAVSDRIGRNMTYTVIFAIQVVVFFIMANLHSLAGVGIAFAIVLLCYGGGFGVMPSFNADYFGTKFLGQNYGMIITAWGLAGVVGPLIAAKVKDATGSFTGALVPVAIMLLIAAVIPFFIKKPQAVLKPHRAWTFRYFWRARETNSRAPLRTTSAFSPTSARSAPRNSKAGLPAQKRYQVCAVIAPSAAARSPMSTMTAPCSTSKAIPTAPSMPGISVLKAPACLG